MGTSSLQEGTFSELPILSRLPDIVLGLLRGVAGLMLVQHGVQKHLGWLLSSGQTFVAPEMFSRMWIAGTLEIVGGMLLAAGMFTRPVAFVLAGLMAAAYFIAHTPRGFWPILNGGELAALYCFVFLMFSVVGGGRYSLDGIMGRTRPVELNRPRRMPPPSMQGSRRRTDVSVRRD
jgi:putative oxidoreductase